MATMTETPETMSTEIKYEHMYHAEAHVLSGALERPIEQKIEKHAPVALKDLRGAHLTRSTQDISIEGLISYKRGHTRVSGSRSRKHQGWVTLSTSILEGLNVFEIVTADRVVAQLSTDHLPDNRYVPRVTFLGTQFNGIRLSGFPINLEIDLGICGDKPAGDRPYLEESSFLRRIREQAETLSGTIAKAKDLPVGIKDQYDKRLATINELISHSLNGNGKASVTCSLVKSIDIRNAPIPGLRTVGNLLLIPEFGTVALGELEVGIEPMTGFTRPSNYFTLRMVDIVLGCVGHGTVQGGGGSVNGGTRP